MPRVYITNRSGHDFSSAITFGTLCYLSEGKIDPYQMSKIYREFADILKDSSPDDFLMITGLPVMNSIAAAIMSYLHGQVNWLQYHAQSNTYKARTLKIGELLNKET